MIDDDINNEFKEVYVILRKANNNDDNAARTHVVSFEVEVSEVEGDAVLSWSNDLPDTVLVRRIQLRERRTLDGAVSRINVPSTCVC